MLLKKSTDKIVENASTHLVDGLFFSKKILAWYRSQERPLPWRVLWAKHRDPWHIWVSEIMLQQTLIKSVIPVYERFLVQYPSWAALAVAPQEDVRLAVRGLGYYRRFDLLHKACRVLQGESKTLPTSHVAWLELPGIGPYTAAAIASITLNLPHGVVDGNVERVFCRLLDIRTEPNLPALKKQFKKAMDEICHLGSAGDVNQAVMELGQTICTPTNPVCEKCPLQQICRAYSQSSQALAPAAKTKQAPIDVKLRLEIVHSVDHVELFLRPNDATFLKGTWGFPTFRLHDTRWQSDGQSPRGPSPAKRKAIGSIKHSITKHRITAEVEVHAGRKLTESQQTRLLAFKDVEKNLVSNLDRKAWNLFLKTKRVARL
jgi:A/G-specific adenine glycosylase